ncbi:UNVERIFIED_CONTAM: hypothetical protein FKN15_045266 [Acipenser sinensis]
MHKEEPLFKHSAVSDSNQALFRSHHSDLGFSLYSYSREGARLSYESSVT